MPKPIAPAPALRSQPDTFSANAEAQILYIPEAVDYIDEQADIATAAALVGDLPDLTDQGGRFVNVLDDETGVGFETLLEAPSLTGNAGKALAVNNTEDGIDTVDFVDVAAFLNATGDAPSYSVRLWANLNGADPVAINESGNLATFTRFSAGVYGITFTDDMPVANYAVSFAGSRPSPGTSGQADGNIYIDAQTASSLNFTCVDGGSGGAATDLATICITIVC